MKPFNFMNKLKSNLRNQNQSPWILEIYKLFFNF